MKFAERTRSPKYNCKKSDYRVGNVEIVASRAADNGLDKLRSLWTHQQLKLADYFTLSRDPPKYESGYPYYDDQNRSERKQGVERERGTHPRGVVLKPGTSCLSGKIPHGGEKTRSLNHAASFWLVKVVYEKLEFDPRTFVAARGRPPRNKCCSSGPFPSRLHLCPDVQRLWTSVIVRSFLETRN